MSKEVAQEIFHIREMYGQSLCTNPDSSQKVYVNNKIWTISSGSLETWSRRIHQRYRALLLDDESRKVSRAFSKTDRLGWFPTIRDLRSPTHRRQESWLWSRSHYVSSKMGYAVRVGCSAALTTDRSVGQFNSFSCGGGAWERWAD